MPQAQNPAGVSGPGPLSRRTDGGPAQALKDLPDAKYGENSQFQALQKGAPLSASGSGASGTGMDPGNLPPNPAAGQVVPFNSQSTRPNEPVTAGAALGPGPGLSALGSTPTQVGQQNMGKIGQSLPFFEMMANMPDAEPSTRLLVNLIRGSQ